MPDYPEPVAQLLKRGQPRGAWPDYTQLGLRTEHIADLIRLATDPALHEGDPDSAEVWAPVHAWRALGQLRAEAAVEPLVQLLRKLNERDDDWSFEELPDVFGLIGPAALPALEVGLGDTSGNTYFRAALGRGVREVAAKHPEARERSVAILTRQLEQFGQNAPELNGLLLGDLLELDAVGSAPVIERAFAADAIDPSIAGDWEDVRWQLGLRDTPPEGRRNYVAEKLGITWPPGELPPRPARSARERAKARRKEVRKARKKNRKKR